MREARYMRLISWTLQSGSEHLYIFSYINVSIYLYIYICIWIYTYIHVCCHFKRKTETQENFSLIRLLCSSCKRKFVVCWRRNTRKNLFAKNELNGLTGFAHQCVCIDQHSIFSASPVLYILYIFSFRRHNPTSQNWKLWIACDIEQIREFVVKQ